MISHVSPLPRGPIHKISKGDASKFRCGYVLSRARCQTRVTDFLDATHNQRGGRLSSVASRSLVYGTAWIRARAFGRGCSFRNLPPGAHSRSQEPTIPMRTTLGFQRRLARKETTAAATDNSPPGYVALLEDATHTIGVKRSMAFEYVSEDDNAPTRDRRIEEVERAEAREQQVATWHRNSDQSYSSLSPQMKPCIESGTDKVLTFLQSARENNIPVRSGKWSCEEDQYLRVLVTLFCDGVLEDVEQKTSMRAWLSKMLNCCPMRISKKQMHGEKFTGKAKFQRSSERIKYMTQTEYDQSCIDVIRLRTNFINYWAKEEFNRTPSRRCILSFEDWQKKISAIVPEAKVAKNPRLAEFNRNNLQQSVVTPGNDRNGSRRKRHRTTGKTNVTVELRSSTRVRHQSRKFCSYETQTCEIVHEDECSPMTIEELSLSQPSQQLEPSSEDSVSTVEERMIVSMETESEMCATQMLQSTFLPSTPSLHHVSMNMDFMNTMDQYQIEDLLIPRKSDDIFLDFGTPSLWSLDDAKNAYPGHCEWNDDDLFDDLAMLYEPEILAMSNFAQDTHTISHQGCANPEILDATTMFCGYAPMI